VQKFDPAGLIAVDKMGGKVLFVEPESWKTQIVLDDFAPVPHELFIMPDRKLAFIPIYGPGVHSRNPNPGHLLAMVDLTTRRHIGDIDLSPHLGPHGIQLAPDGMIYVTCETTGVVVLIDPERRAMVDTIATDSTNSHRLAILPDGSRLYTENEEDGTLSVIDLGTRKLIRKVAMPRPLAGIAVSPDGKTIVAVDDGKPALVLVDTARDVPVDEVELKDHPRGAQIARYSPDGNHLLVTSSRAGLATLLDPDFRRQTTFQTGVGPMDSCFHPDGERCFIANQRDGTVTIVDLKERRVSGSFNAGIGCETLGFF
jgi:YVTN family beta-propeller protein